MSINSTTKLLFQTNYLYSKQFLRQLFVINKSFKDHPSSKLTRRQLNHQVPLQP